jgi:heterodisulfide reductase subunit A-like polyferredoxin
MSEPRVERIGDRAIVEAWGLRFDVDASARSDADVLAAVRGPYCAACRRSVASFSYGEWNVVEREAAPLPERCTACGAAFTPPSRDPEALARLAFRAARGC